MQESELLARRFEDHRDRLQAVAYRMLGSPSEADDAAQETWLRVSGADTERVDNLGGWLTTVIGRICLDRLRVRNARREEAPEGHEPAPSSQRRHERSPEDDVELADSVGLALLVVLETLQPAERVAFVLHDMFDLTFDEIAPRGRCAPWSSSPSAAGRSPECMPSRIAKPSPHWSSSNSAR